MLRKLYLPAILASFVQVAGMAQTPPELVTAGDKFEYHILHAYGPLAIAKTAVTSGYRQLRDSPPEWGQGMEGYGKRIGSALAYNGIRNVVAFGIDSTLHQNPIYDRSTSSGFKNRTMHALRRVVVTRTDSGGQTFAAWRFGSAYSAAFISNTWEPDRLKTAGHALATGTYTLGFDALSNLLSEFLPDLKKKLRRH